MKKSLFKKTATFLMACAVAVSAAAPMAFAADDDITTGTNTNVPETTADTGKDDSFTITIRGGSDFDYDSNNTYAAYQLFSGKIAPKTPTKDEFAKSIAETYETWQDLIDDIDNTDFENEAAAEAAYEEAVEEAKEANVPAGLYKLKWGAAFGSDEDTVKNNVAAFLTAIKNSDNNLLKVNNENAFKDVETAQQLADVLVANYDNDALMKEFSIIAGEFMAANGNPSEKSKLDGNAYVIEGLKAGYYIVVDETKIDPSKPAGYSKSLPIIQMAGDLDVYLKSALPSLDKTITGVNNGKFDTKNAVVGIGTTVEFELKVQLPENYNKYDSYYLSFSDTLPEGLTLLDGYKFTIKDDDKETVVEDYEISFDTWGEDWGTYLQPEGAQGGIYKDVKVIDQNTVLKINIPDLKKYAEKNSITIGDKYYITLKYSAVVNAKAKAEDTIINKAEIKFSNNPNHSKYGEMQPGDSSTENPPSPPDGDTDTRESHANVSVFQIVLDKNDGDGDVHKHLAGAKFEITDGSKTAMFHEDDEGQYTFVAWLESGKTIDEWISSEDNQKLYEAIFGVEYDDGDLTTEVISALPEDDEHNSLTLKGLAPGTYKITETDAPTGYQKVESFTVTLDPQVEWSVKYNGDTDELTETLTGSYSEFLKYAAGKITTVTVEEAEYDITSFPSENDFTYTGILEYKIVTITEDGEEVIIESTRVEGDANAAENVTLLSQKSTDHTAQLNVIDDPKNGLPSTGGAGAYFYYITGAILAIAGIGTIIVSRKRSGIKA